MDHLKIIKEKSINENEVWKDDRLNRETISKFLTNILEKTNTPFVINLDAKWGDGKTFFLKRWAEDLKKTHPVVYFNAWENDYSPDPLSSFIVELSEQILSSNSNKAVNKNIKSIQNHSLKILKTAIPIILKGGIRYILGNDGLKDIKELLPEDVESALGSVAESVAKDLLESHTKRKIAVKQIKLSLSDSVKELCNDHIKIPMFVFIDELDRCKPSYAVQTLEFIKHIFNVENIIFIVSTDTSQLIHTISSLYGSNFDSETYLRRFFDFKYNLPKVNREKYIESVFDELEINNLTRAKTLKIKRNEESNILLPEYILNEFVESFDLSQRDINQIVSRYRVLLLNQDSIPISIELFFFFESVQRRKPQLLSKFFSGNKTEINAVARQLTENSNITISKSISIALDILRKLSIHQTSDQVNTEYNKVSKTDATDLLWLLDSIRSNLVNYQNQINLYQLVKGIIF